MDMCRYLDQKNTILYLNGKMKAEFSLHEAPYFPYS